jgi:putative transcriptional regulator
MVRWALKEIAEPERWSARRLAKESGLSYSAVYYIWANKTRRVDFDTLEKLCRILKVGPGDLIVCDEPQNSTTPHT